MDLKELEWEEVHQIHLAWNGYQGWAVVDIIMNRQVL
jgi:hypothetical protein